MPADSSLTLDSLQSELDAEQPSPAQSPTTVEIRPRARPSVARLVWPIVAALIMLTGFSMLSLESLMAMRAYGYGENLWVKNQKSATLQLLRYASSGDEAALLAHDRSVAVQGHFDRARRAMIAVPRDDRGTFDSLVRAGVPENDAGKAVWANRWFGWTPQHRRIMDIWQQADNGFAGIHALRQAVLDARSTGHREALAASQSAIMRLDSTIIPLAKGFSDELARTSYVVYGTLVTVAFGLAIGLGIAVVGRTRAIWRAHGEVERQLGQERQRATVTLASIGDAVVTIDAGVRITYMNDAACALTMVSEPPSLARPAHASVLNIVQTASGHRVDVEALVNDAKSDGDHVLMRPDGTSVPVSWTATQLLGGDTTGSVVVIRNVSREQKLVSRLTWLATHDPLTRLPNRREFEARLNAALNALRIRPDDGDAQHVVMLVDLDQFKIVNDTSGHPAGDELLRLVSNATRSQLRENDTLARMGGDEFAVLLLNCSRTVGERKAEAIRKAIQQVRLDWQGRVYANITASIGVVHVRRDMPDSASVMSAADVACYLAKDRGRDQVSVYQVDEDELKLRHGDMAWPQRLREAVSSDRLKLFGQTYLGLQDDTRHKHHCEVLLRLEDETGKLVSPGEFLPAAERYGMMPMIDRWVVDKALSMVASQPARAIDGMVFGINLSGSAFGDDAFLTEIQHLFERHGVRYDQVCFEITETQAISDVRSAARFIGVLRAKGASFALDDFGAGMSSLTYLKHLPVDYLKIDGRLVRDMVADEVNHAMVEMISRLGDTLGIRTVGEFAEDGAIIDALRRVGVDYAQGYGVARPRPLEDVLRDPQRLAAITDVPASAY